MKIEGEREDADGEYLCPAEAGKFDSRTTRSDKSSIFLFHRSHAFLPFCAVLVVPFILYHMGAAFNA